MRHIGIEGLDSPTSTAGVNRLAKTEQRSYARGCCMASCLRRLSSRQSPTWKHGRATDNSVLWRAASRVRTGIPRGPGGEQESSHKVRGRASS